MTVKDGTSETADLKALVASDPDFVRVLVRTALQEVLEAEMDRVPWRSLIPPVKAGVVSSAAAG